MFSKRKMWAATAMALCALAAASLDPPRIALAAAAGTGSATGAAGSEGANVSSAMTDLTSQGALSIAVSGIPDATFAREETSYQSDVTQMSGWRGFSHQGSRTITLTFTSPVDVKSIHIQALQNFSLGIYFPSDVEFQFDQNGQWYTAGQRPSAIPQSDQRVMTQTFAWSSAAGIEASAVRLVIPVDVWVFVNGFDVQGSRTERGLAASTLPKVVAASIKAPGPLLPSAPNAAGIRNMLLVQTGANGSQGTWSVQDFEPMLAYVTERGQMTKPLFDTMLFLPYGSVQDTEQGLSAYLQDLFAPGKQLSALNQAVAVVNQALHRPGYQEKVVLSLPYFAYGLIDFGAVDGKDVQFDGGSGDPNGLAGREQAETWYVHQLLDDWKKADFKNLKLVGFYWNEEQYRQTMPGEAPYIQFASALAKANNLPLFWIPYYGAGGVWQWQSLGFTAAWIQPNFVEQGQQADLARMTNATETASRLGLGVEVELTGIDVEHQAVYDSSLAQLSADGYGTGEASHAYYDGSKLLLTSERSQGSERIAYDTTASFIAGVGIHGGS
ncbi:DUF4855 domain-containing protein [Alicyclobacillus sacchari]|nr:DUF4855 domain-containing protein [Alicyclobacillus sacchari]